MSSDSDEDVIHRPSAIRSNRILSSDDEDLLYSPSTRRSLGVIWRSDFISDSEDDDSDNSSDSSDIEEVEPTGYVEPLESGINNSINKNLMNIKEQFINDNLSLSEDENEMKPQLCSTFYEDHAKAAAIKMEPESSLTPIKHISDCNESNSTSDVELIINDTSAEGISNKDSVVLITDENSLQEVDDTVQIHSHAPALGHKNSLTHIKSSSDYNDDPNKTNTTINDTSAEIIADEDSVQEVNENKTQPRETSQLKSIPTPKTVYVTSDTFMKEKQILDGMRDELAKITHLIKNINLDTLQDGGQKLIDSKEVLVINIREQAEKISNMLIVDNKSSEAVMKGMGMDNIAEIAPKTFGKQALETFGAQKILTVATLKNIHGSLETCPDQNTFAKQPRQVKVALKKHQLSGLAWLIWRESQKPHGGILADDMGLGKTLQMISLIIHDKYEGDDDDSSNSDRDSDEEEWMNKQNKNKILPGGTLIVCPASLMSQWENEIKQRCSSNSLSVHLHHGPRRKDVRLKYLASEDVVISSYKTIMIDHDDAHGVINRIKWRRIILDEAHVIRNHKSKSSVAVCNLKARNRWVLTGTPIQNKEQDLYALIKFLKCRPFDDLAHWKRWVVQKGAGGQERLNTILKGLLLRRTKEQLQANNEIEMPEKEEHVIDIFLDKEEMNVYQKVLLYSQTLFAEFLKERAQKEGNLLLDPSNQRHYYKTHQKMSKFVGNKGDINSIRILVLLCRLRQICSHCSLIFNMLEEDEACEGSLQEYMDNTDILNKLNKLVINDGDDDDDDDDEITAARPMNIMSKRNPVFKEGRISSKLRVVLDLITEKVGLGDKVLVVSQWTSILDILGRFLQEQGQSYVTLTGKVAVADRALIVDKFNVANKRPKIMLLSLTAGGVGLNLVGGNHVIIMDLHWNPQLESQAQDRIYRIGQEKKVHVYKFVTKNTIEEKIKNLQERKLLISQSVLTGVKCQQTSKLTIDELKALFGVGEVIF